jgi:kinesin family protein 6/9
MAESSTTATETIQIFARVRPCREKSGNKRYQLDQPVAEDEKPQLHFTIPKNEADGLINNTRENYDFRFNRVFDQQTTQEEVFDVVAKNVVDRYEGMT